MLENEPDKTPFRPYSLPVPLSEVRLVARLPHPETGIERDVVINELAKGSIRDPKPYYDKSRDKSTKGRYIAGLVPRTFIPWPKKATEEWDDNDSDTLRLDVEEATFTPTLHEPPMPMSIIDELRNKYSKFRTRHDDEYVEKVKAQDRTKRENKEMLKLKMVTPMQELKLKEKALKDAEGTPQLSKELLASIGQVMAKNGQRAVPPKAGM
jgi:large subunit ribosomal protein L24